MKITDLVKGFKFDSPGVGNHTYEITSRKGDSLSLVRDDGMVRFTTANALLDTINHIEKERKELNAKSSKN
jgi:hypothetical protein